jgi:hypothetical protein
MQNQETTKLEFILTIEKNIVIQRFFNVFNFNPISKNSLDLYKCVKEICKDISDDLKIKTLDYLNDNQNYFFDLENFVDVPDTKEEHFLLEIKLGEDVFISRIFPAHVYHPKVRYAVDIRPKVKEILSNLTDVLSSKNLTTKYLQYDLNLKEL